MNQFTKLAQQAQSLFAGMNPQSKLIAILLVVAIAVSCGMLVSNQTGREANGTFLFDGTKFNEEQLSKFELALATAGLNEWNRVDGKLRIPEGKKSEYYKAIANAKVAPVGLHSRLAEALKETNFLEPTRTTDAKHLQARLAAISSALEEMPFVQSALVVFDAEREGFSAKRTRVASIAIQTRQQVALTAEQAHAIIRYVSTSIAGLRQEDISLIEVDKGRTWTGQNDPMALEQERYYQIKKQQERDLKQRAEYLLADYGNVRLDVSVELDPTLSEETSRVNYDPKSTTIQSSTTRKDTDNQRVSNGGRPGTEPNALANRSASISQTPDQVSKGKESSESTKQVVGSTLSTVRRAGLQTKQVSFSVMVPFSYYRTAYIGEWLQLNPGKTEADAPNFDEAALATKRQQVETNIKNVLATIVQTPTPGEDKTPNITVGHYIDFPEAVEPAPSLASQGLEWLTRSWQTLLLAFVALIAIASMRSFAKSSSHGENKPFENGFDIPLDDALDIQLSGLDDEEEFSSQDTALEERSKPRLKTTGNDLKTELTTMVRENPDAAATLLRNWIGGSQSPAS